MIVFYRLRQGIRALTAFARPVDYDTARRHLSPGLMALFGRMRRSEQQHSIEVLRTLRAMGHTDPDLMVAALLHDVGKSRAPFHFWDRVLVVLVEALCPTCFERWGRGAPVGWRRPFVVGLQHAAWGAEMVREAGGSARAAELVARSDAVKGKEPPAGAIGELLAALVAADNVN
ncbi:MAG: HD domain-containing protein [Anaerolineae bacterium]|nr:HD domain-containing protein [Anaerolineae bacterium]